MAKNYRFSIIVPIYNTKKEFLEYSLNSLMNLDYDNYEIIIVDDGSNEKTKEIIESFKDKKIVSVKNSTNCGQHISRINGVVKSTGDYVLFVDSDDLLNSKSLLTINNILNTKQYDMIMFGYSRFIDSINNIRYVHNYFCEGELNKYDVLKELVSFHINGACLKCTKKSLINTVINKDIDTSLREGEDLALSTELVINSNSFYYTNKTIYYYRFSEENREYYSYKNTNTVNSVILTYKIILSINKNEELLKIFKNSAINMIIYKSFNICWMSSSKKEKEYLLNELNSQPIIKILLSINHGVVSPNGFIFKLLTKKMYSTVNIISKIYKITIANHNNQ